MTSWKLKLVVFSAVSMILLAGCADDGKKSAASGSTVAKKAIDDRLAELSGAGVFVGGVAFTGNLVGIHFEGKDSNAPGMRIFVTDGTPGGPAEWFEGKATGRSFKFTSASGTAAIEGLIEPFEVDGKITFADGVIRNFFTRPAGDGAGVFDVTVAGNGEWTGKSLDGSTFTARQEGIYVKGHVASTAGEKYEFRHNDLARRLAYPAPGGTPDSYLTVITRQATEIQGRGGDVRGGKPNANIVSLDLDQSAKPTPGVFHGRVASTTDRLNFELQTSPDGSQMLRSYVSDSEPEPKGDIQWFSEPVAGSEFAITSKTGDAKLSGSIKDDGISGEITLPNAPPSRFFAAPSGEGAGIYTVTVAADRGHTGSSEQGGKIDLKYVDGTVMGSITSPEGERFAMLGADLSHAYGYGDEFSKPDTYVAFVAPRGRYVFGRSGNVRGGSPGANIIGLDKKC